MKYKSLERGIKGEAVKTAVSEAYYPTEYFDSGEIGVHDIGDDITLVFKARVVGVRKSVNDAKTRYDVELREIGVKDEDEE